MALFDGLTAEAAGRCVELHRPAPAGAVSRRDGRPVGEHVVDRLHTTTAVWSQEAGLLAWAGEATGPAIAESNGGDAQAVVAEAVAGEQRMVLVVGPAGTGKTTALGQAARLLADQGRPVIGLAPSGKAADVLATETGWAAVPVAKLLHEHRRPGGPLPAWHLPAGTSVILDEASMASTDDLDALVGLVERHRWRLVCVGDTAQLPAVGRGGVFALWCERLPAQHLEEVRALRERLAGSGQPGPAPGRRGRRGRLRHPSPAARRPSRPGGRPGGPPVRAALRPRDRRGRHHRLGRDGPGGQRRHPAPAQPEAGR